MILLEFNPRYQTKALTQKFEIIFWEIVKAKVETEISKTSVVAKLQSTLD